MCCGASAARGMRGAARRCVARPRAPPPRIEVGREAGGASSPGEGGTRVWRIGPGLGDDTRHSNCRNRDAVLGGAESPSCFAARLDKKALFSHRGSRACHTIGPRSSLALSPSTVYATPACAARRCLPRAQRAHSLSMPRHEFARSDSQTVLIWDTNPHTPRRPSCGLALGRELVRLSAAGRPHKLVTWQLGSAASSKV